jgi:hypothetical protein
MTTFKIASRLWTPLTRPEQLKRPDSGRSDTGQSARTVQSNNSSRAGRFAKTSEKKPNCIVYCTSIFYGFQPAKNMLSLTKLISVNLKQKLY